ncbi:MAG: FAD-binding protein [Desulfobacterales bacterium]|nr:FAD-binding protein [Desulfobacterales bacterium]
MERKPITAPVFKQIQRIVGKANCSREKEDRLCYAFDATRQEALPDAVAFPENSSQISQILMLANAHNFAVIPRGAGTGMSGGSVPVAGGLVVVMTRFNRIIGIDTDNLIVHVEPGVVTGAFQKAVREKGLFYPPDPASSEFSTLGGNVAECAGGPKAVKYGVTRDYVLGLEVVLPTGEIIHTGVKTAKGVVGYDLTRLLTGSEGTLGVITNLTLRLLPLPETVKTLTALYDRMETAAETVSEIIRRGIIPRTIEFMDNASIRCVENYLNMGLPEDVAAMLIIEVDGSAEAVREAAEAIHSLCMEMGARRVDSACSPEAAAQLWQARKSISPALYTLGPDKINEDIVVPRSRIPDMVRKIKSLSQSTGLTMVGFGHAGDGNIHFNIMLDKKDAAALEKANSAVEEIFDYTLELGGTLSGEHGIGISKAQYMGKEIAAPQLALMKRIKKAFDPAGILNPGKMKLS